MKLMHVVALIVKQYLCNIYVVNGLIKLINEKRKKIFYELKKARNINANSVLIEHGKF